MLVAGDSVLVAGAITPAGDGLLPPRGQSAGDLLRVEGRVDAAGGEQLGVRAALDDAARRRRRRSRRRRRRSTAGARSRSSCARATPRRGPPARRAPRSVSSALVASSRMSTAGSFSSTRAIAMRCFSPPLQPVAALADDGVVAVGERRDRVVDVRRLRRRLELGVASHPASRSAGSRRSWRGRGRSPG